MDLLTALLMTTLSQHPHHPLTERPEGPSAGRHGNPEELRAYIARQESAERVAWQKPEQVVEALGLKPGQVACDIGAGPGFFALRLARAVGERGTVFAVEVEPRIIEVLRQRIEDAGARNVVPVLGLPGDPLLPLRSCDVILMVNVFHHVQERVGYLQRLARSLRPGGRIVNVDFHKRELPVGPPVDQKISREQFLGDAQRAGLRVVAQPELLPHQYVVVMKAPARPAR